jgi:glucose/arabinose dehydrogenase
MMPRRLVLLATLLALADQAAPADAPRSPTPASQPDVFAITTVAKDIDHGWGFVFLPDNRILLTERAGRMRFVGSDGELSAPLQGLPPIAARGQGGLLDVTLGPDFANDRLVYFSFAEAGNGGVGTAVARGRLAASSVENVQVIWRQQPKVGGGNHFGSRVVFRDDGTLFVTMGDRYKQRPKVQDLRTTIGKVVRINADGSVPRDNPFVGRARVLPEIWSYGHRNVQAATLHPQTRELWTIEHGARGGDELNNPQAGRNYGWPVITYGVDYSGESIGIGTAKSGMEQPVYYWDPVIAPSGALFYTGQAFSEWQGDLFVGSMTPGGLVRLDLEDGRVREETRYLGELHERIRDVQQGSDGLLYVLTDANHGRLLRLAPKSRPENLPKNL